MHSFHRFKTRVVFVLLLCSLLLASMLFYFLFAFDEKINISRIDNSKPVMVLGFNEVRTKNETLKTIYQKQLASKVQRLVLQHANEQEDGDISHPFITSLKDDLLVDENLASDYNRIWSIPKKWIRARQTIPPKAPELGAILHAMQTAKILKSDVSRKGTQLKLLLTLEGGQYALFKPKRYSRDYTTDDIYAGADRHNGEIFAFHLSRMLNMRYAPIVASRKLNVQKDIKQLASPALLNTFVNQTDKDNRTQQSLECFYGECFYCNEYDLVCPDDQGLIEGAMILLLPLHFKLQKLRNPWQRTYKKNLKSKWENDSHYCLTVRKGTPNQQRVLDFVDVSIFDYLIGNADRHHYEVFKDVPNSALLLIDNGKSFGDPSHDEVTVLFPLLQCCIVRNSTYQQLRKLSTLKLSRIATHLLSEDVLWPLLTPAHLEALDRRLVTILAAIEVCFESFNKKNVLKH